LPLKGFIMRASIRWFTAACLAVLVSSGMAQTPQTVRLQGSIESAEGLNVAVKLRDGSRSTIALSPNATIVVLTRSSVAEISEGSYVAIAARPQEDGTQRAVEVRIFPEVMRGVGDGHRPYEPVPQGTMTNGATTAAPVTRVDGTSFTVRYKDGEKKVLVPPEVMVVKYVVGSTGDLVSGARFLASTAAPQADGSFKAGRINVDRYGIVAP
jgi:ferric-dicitrate binding protein FerR (iron transport regulator)